MHKEEGDSPAQLKLADFGLADYITGPACFISRVGPLHTQRPKYFEAATDLLLVYSLLLLSCSRSSQAEHHCVPTQVSPCIQARALCLCQAGLHIGTSSDSSGVLMHTCRTILHRPPHTATPHFTVLH